MKKLKNSGFTLIELLAVITIMGILMMVAIPSVSKVIANSRRDAFVDIVQNYVNSVRDLYVGDNIKCEQNGEWVPASAAPQGTYFIPICTGTGEGLCEDVETGKEGKKLKFAAENIKDSTLELLEKGGKSSYGSADMRGYIKMQKVTSTEKKIVDGKEVEVSTGNSKVIYSVLFIDAGFHGIPAETEEKNLDRSVVSAEISSESSDPRTNQPADVSNAHVCKVV